MIDDKLSISTVKTDNTDGVVPVLPAVELPAVETNNKQMKKEEKLEKAGATREVVYKRLAEGLSATKKEWDEDIDGKVFLVSSEPDFLIRHKYLETALKLYGDLAPEGNSVNVVNIDQRTNEEILKRVREAVVSVDKKK